MQRSALCRSRRELSNEYFLAKFGLDTAENEPSKVCPIERCTQPAEVKSLDEAVKDKERPAGAAGGGGGADRGALWPPAAFFRGAQAAFSNAVKSKIPKEYLKGSVVNFKVASDEMLVFQDMRIRIDANVALAAMRHRWGSFPELNAGVTMSTASCAALILAMTISGHIGVFIRIPNCFA